MWIEMEVQKFVKLQPLHRLGGREQRQTIILTDDLSTSFFALSGVKIMYSCEKEIPEAVTHCV